jgi:hypothetical protein
MPDHPSMQLHVYVIGAGGGGDWARPGDRPGDRLVASKAERREEGRKASPQGVRVKADPSALRTSTLPTDTPRAPSTMETGGESAGRQPSVEVARWVSGLARPEATSDTSPG